MEPTGLPLMAATPSPPGKDELLTAGDKKRLPEPSRWPAEGYLGARRRGRRHTRACATDEQNVRAISLPVMPDGKQRPVEEARAFGPLGEDHALPVRGSFKHGRNVTDFQLPDAVGQNEDDGLVGGHSPDVAIVVGFQPVAKLSMTSIDRVSDHPANGKMGLLQT